MALTLDTTVGGEFSNAYITEIEADALLEEKFSFSPVWLALTQQNKFALIISATRAIDRYNIIGSPVNNDQALKFPTTTQLTDPFDPDGEIPDEVKRATAEMIMYLVQTADATTGQVGDEIEEVDVFQQVRVKFKSFGKKSNTDSATGGNLEAVERELRKWLVGENTFGVIK